MKRSSSRAHVLALHSMLTALMLILGFVESRFILVPGIPGIKLGLSNIVLLFALYLLNAKSAWLLMLLKVLLSGVLFSGITGMSYALCGGIYSVLIMHLLLRIRFFSAVGVSICGAVCHILGQMLCARILLGTWAPVIQLPYLLLAALITGTLTGLIAERIIRIFASRIKGFQSTNIP